MRRLALALAFIPAVASAQPASKPEMVLIPRAVAEAAAQWIAAPEAGSAVRLYAALSSCLADNPSSGVTIRTGRDQCPTVTEALAARDKEIADLKKQVDDLKAAKPSK